jgi:hypothetical protein
MMRSPVLKEIESLDPVRDHQRIVFLSCRVDFPWDTTRALEFALFRAFAIPSISALLHRTREFEERAQKRYDDTDIIVSNIMEHGYDSELGRASIQRMNALHGRFNIRNEDFLYVLSTFVFEPIRWNQRFGWRRMIESECLAMFHFWGEVGKRMSIQDIPEELHHLREIQPGLRTGKVSLHGVQRTRRRCHPRFVHELVSPLSGSHSQAWHPRLHG